MQLLKFLTEHPLFKSLELIQEKNTALWVRLTVQDYGKVEGLIRPLLMFGEGFPEIGHRIENGIETVNALFSKSPDFVQCSNLLCDVYGKGFVGSEIEKKEGLCAHVPLFLEALLDHKMQLEKHRQLMDMFLKKGYVKEDSDREEMWLSEVFSALESISPSTANWISKTLFGTIVPLRPRFT